MKSLSLFKNIIFRIYKRFLEQYRRLKHAYSILNKRLIQLSVKTHVDLPSDFVFQTSKAVSRGRQAPDQKYYSSTYELDYFDFPPEIKQEIRNFDTVLRLYFGGDYLINSGNVWRNIGIPAEFRALDIYSQVWHYDRVVDYRNIQFFVLLTDTTDEHGPLEYITNASETHVNPSVEARNITELTNAQIAKLVGVRGDGIWFSTGATPHRAGIPLVGNHRDIFSVSFFPTYTKIGRSARALYQSEGL